MLYKKNYSTCAIIPIAKQNTRHKSFLFIFFSVKNYFRNKGYEKNFCLEKEKYILIYLSGVLLHNWYYKKNDYFTNRIKFQTLQNKTLALHSLYIKAFDYFCKRKKT